MKLILAAEFYDSFEITRKLLGDNLKGKKVSLIPTAAYGEGFEPAYETNIKPFEQLGLSVTLFDIAEKSPQEVKDEMDTVDIIYICGGNTFSLLYHMNACGFKDILMNFLDRGGVYIGSSAGSIIASPDIEFISSMDDRTAVKLDNYIGLNLIDFPLLPHLDHKTMGKDARKIMEHYKDGSQSILALCDNQVLYVDGKIIRVI